MDRYNHVMDNLRDMLQTAEADLIEKKEQLRKVKERKDAADADYEYYKESVLGAQKNITNIKNMMDDVLDETGI